MRKERFLILLVILLSLFIIRPLLVKEGDGFKILDILTIIMFLSCINAISTKRRHIYISSFLFGLALLARFLATADWGESLDITFHVIFNGMSTLFLLYTSILILDYVLGGGEVTRDRIAAAICVYLLLGLIWSNGYQLLYTLDSEAFDLGNAAVAVTADEKFSEDFNYFSYVTLTTLGYGDITPKSGPAKQLATLEAIIGQLYMAVLIARLVGMYIAQKGAGKE